MKFWRILLPSAFEFKKLLITCIWSGTICIFFADIAARFLNRNSDRKRRWLFLLSFLLSRLNNMTDFNLWLLSSRLRHWPTYFHDFFFFWYNDSQKKKSVACFHWMPKLFRRVDDFFCCHLWLDIRSRTYLIMGWNYFWRSIHNFQHLLFHEIYLLLFILTY